MSSVEVTRDEFNEVIRRIKKLEKQIKRDKKSYGEIADKSGKKSDGETDDKSGKKTKALSKGEIEQFKVKIEEINNTSIYNANEIKKTINKDRKCRSTLIKQIRKFLEAEGSPPYKKEDIVFYSTIQEEFDDESKEILKVLNPNKIADQNDNNEEESEVDSNSNSDSDSDSDNKNSESVNPVKPNSDESDSDSDSDSD